MIIVDSREPQRVVKKLKEMSSNAKNNGKVFEIKIETLSYGDYIVTGNGMVVIERKNVFDLLNSVTDGRLWEQLKGLENYKDAKKVLLIEGSVWNVARVRAKGKSKAERTSLYFQYIKRVEGAVVSALMGWDISVVFTSNEDGTVYFLYKLNEKLGNTADEGKKYYTGVVKSGRSKDDEVIEILMGVTGIGSVTAKKLLEEFKSIYGIVKAKKSDLVRVIGEEKGNYLYSILRYEWKEVSGNDADGNKV
jgi:Fanconi anemia group M protein